MEELLCAVCGGQIEINSTETLGTCLYCGTINTISTNHKKKQNLFNRATHLRLNKDFHGSMKTYEKLLDEDQTDAEAHWGLVLSRYGIEYIKDNKRGEYLPTLHRMQKKSILLDIDYRDALTYARPESRRIYEERAQRIDDIYKKYEVLTENEPSYDVFICYKETDDRTGRRTKDSVYAHEIYTALTKAGMKVFFARKTLEGKLGLDFEPLIFSALNSAKIMIVVATSSENVNAVWVRNEWERYLELCEEKDSDKNIIPVYYGMTPYDLPDELSSKQSLNMENLGFMQDLLDGIKKLSQQKAYSTSSMPYYGGFNIGALLKRGQLALEDHNWEGAQNYYDQVLNMDAENGNAYLGLFLASQESESIDMLISNRLTLTQNAESQVKCMELDDAGVIEKAAQQYCLDGYFSSEDIKTRYNFDRNYLSYVLGRQKQIAEEMNFWENDILLNKIMRFGDEQTKQHLLDTKEKIISAMQQRIIEAEDDEKKKRNSLKESYESHLMVSAKKVEEEYDQACERKERDHEIEIKKKYEETSCKVLTGKNAREILKELQHIQGFYRNAKYCTEPKEMNLSKRISQCKKRMKWRKIRPFVILVTVAASSGGIVLAFKWNYKQALQCAENREYDKAENIERSIGFYYKSLDQELLFIKAQNLLEDGDREGAAEIIYDLNHEGCQQLVEEYDLESTNAFKFEEARDLLSCGEYIEAMEQFYELGGYKNSSDYAKNSVIQYIESGTWINDTNSTYFQHENMIIVGDHEGPLTVSNASTDLFKGTPTLYKITDIDLGYIPDNSTFMFNLTLKEHDTEEEFTISVLNLTSESFEIYNVGRYGRTDERPDYFDTYFDNEWKRLTKKSLLPW